MNNMWEVYKDTLGRKYPKLTENMNKGASNDDILRFEQTIGITVPNMFKRMYKANNGDNQEMLCGCILGFHLYSLDEILYEWNDWKDIPDNSDFKTSTPDGYIKKRYTDPGWIPLCDDNGSNYIGIDLDPDEKGTVGQVINFGRDEDDKIVLADSLDSFLERLCRIINSPHFSLEEYDGEDVIVLNGLYHVIDYFKSSDAIK